MCPDAPVSVHAAAAVGAPHDGLTSPPAPRDAREVLLRLPNWLGDVVMAAPTVAAIARALPEARFTAQVIAPFLPLARLLPGVSAVLPAGKDRGPRQLLASRRALRTGRFDLAVVFPRGVRASLAPWLARIPARVGFGGGKGWLLTHGVTGWKPLRKAHRSAFYGALTAPFGGGLGGPWALTPPPEALAQADALLARLGFKGDRPLVAMEPGARYGPAKCWPPERFGEVARALLAEGAAVVTVGTAATQPVEEQVARIAGPGLLRSAGRTDDLLALVGILARSRLLIANDTGPMHLGAALGTPVLALFGATDPRVSAPRGPGPIRIVMDPEPCSPCFLRDCPIPGHPCLTKIAPVRVLREVQAMLAPS
jgi:heptosyltransferase II